MPVVDPARVIGTGREAHESLVLRCRHATDECADQSQELGREGRNCLPKSRAACRRAAAAGRRVLAASYVACFANISALSPRPSRLQELGPCVFKPQRHMCLTKLSPAMADA